MKLQVSLSAAFCKKGDRVVVKIKKNQWHVGTIMMSGIKVKVLFDDDADANIGVSDFKHVKVIDPKAKKNKNELTDEQAKALMEKAPPPVVKKKIVSAKSIKAKIAKSKKAASKTYKRYGFDNELETYLEGDVVSPKWIKETLELRSKDQPNILYRLCIASENAKEGTTINVKKELVSAADKINSAIYGGCSYHRDTETDIEGKRLVVIEIHNPTVLMSLEDIKAAVPAGNRMAHERLVNEREYLIKGPFSGKVIQIVPNSMVYTRNYKALV